MTQPSLVSVADTNTSFTPQSNSFIQVYYDKVLLLLRGKANSGRTNTLTVRLPDCIAVTTDGSPKELILNSLLDPQVKRIKIPINTTQFYNYFVMATRVGGSYASGIAQIQFMVRNVNGVCSVVVTTGALPLNVGDPEAGAWVVTPSLVGDEIVVTATGEDGKNISWNATVLRLSHVDF